MPAKGLSAVASAKTVMPSRPTYADVLNEPAMFVYYLPGGSSESCGDRFGQRSRSWRFSSPFLSAGSPHQIICGTEHRNSKHFWRRGWDSNPRNGFPLTAFPVLPIQPLLHLSNIADCQLPIANWLLRGIDLPWQKTDRQSAIKNRQCSGGEGGIRTHGGR